MNYLTLTTHTDDIGPLSYTLSGMVDGDGVGFSSAKLERVIHELKWYQDNFKDISVSYELVTM
jgi:hypothetical protein